MYSRQPVIYPQDSFLSMDAFNRYSCYPLNNNFVDPVWNLRNNNSYIQRQDSHLPPGAYPVFFDNPVLLPPQPQIPAVQVQINYVSMQLPTANYPNPSLSSRYNSYFGAVAPQSSRPIQIINNGAVYGQQYPFGNDQRVMGLDFLPAAANPVSPAESFYVMDCDDNSTAASTSTHQSFVKMEDKENAVALRRDRQDTIDSIINNRSIQVLGNPCHRTYKRPCPAVDEHLIHEETESEAGISDDEDECLSNCGTALNNQQANAPLNKLGFKSIGDIIGYAQVVRAERSEALAQLRAAVTKFNDLQQRNAQMRAQQREVHH